MKILSEPKYLRKIEVSYECYTDTLDAFLPEGDFIAHCLKDGKNEICDLQIHTRYGGINIVATNIKSFKILR